MCETNSKSIRKAIVEVYKDESLRERMKKEALEFIEKNCSLNKISEKEYALYQRSFKK